MCPGSHLQAEALLIYQARISPIGDILSLLVQRKYAKKARPDEAFSLRYEAIVRAPLTHIHVLIGVDTVLYRPWGPDRTLTSVLAGLIRGNKSRSAILAVVLGTTVHGVNAEIVGFFTLVCGFDSEQAEPLSCQSNGWHTHLDTQG